MKWVSIWTAGNGKTRSFEVIAGTPGAARKAARIMAAKRINGSGYRMTRLEPIECGVGTRGAW